MILLDMKMPETCGECAISYLDHYYSDDPPLMCPLVYCPLGIDKDKRHSDCPIKGEYNPTQSLKEVLSELRYIDTTTDERNWACYGDGLDDAKDVVESKIKECADENNR